MNVSGSAKSINRQGQHTKRSIIQKGKWNGMILREYQMTIFEDSEGLLTSSAGDSPARRSAKTDADEGLKTLEAHCFSKLQEQPKKSNHAIYSLKMSRGYYHTTAGTRSLPSLPRWMNWGTMQNGWCATAKTSYRSNESAHLLSDILESTVEDRYFLSSDLMEKLLVEVEGLEEGQIAIRQATQQGYAIAEPGDSVNYAVPNSKTRRGRVGKRIANTIDTGCQQGVVTDDLRIRR